MKKSQKLLGLVVLLFVGFVVTVHQCEEVSAATKRTVTVKYINSYTKRTIKTSKYKLNKNATKKVAYPLFNGYVRKAGNFTIKANKNKTVTYKYTPTNKVYVNVQYKNSRNKKLLKSSWLTLNKNQKKTCSYTNFDGYEYKWSFETFSVKAGSKNSTKVVYLKPEDVTLYIEDEDIHGDSIYSNYGSLAGTRKISTYYDAKVTAKPLTGYSGYTAPSSKTVTIKETLYQTVTLNYTNKKKTIVYACYKYDNNYDKYFYGNKALTIEYGSLRTSLTTHFTLNGYEFYRDDVEDWWITDMATWNNLPTTGTATEL